MHCDSQGPPSRTDRQDQWIGSTGRRLHPRRSFSVKPDLPAPPRSCSTRGRRLQRAAIPEAFAARCPTCRPSVHRTQAHFSTCRASSSVQTGQIGNSAAYKACSFIKVVVGHVGDGLHGHILSSVKRRNAQPSCFRQSVEHFVLSAHRIGTHGSRAARSLAGGQHADCRSRTPRACRSRPSCRR
jgi:hypothetical protein